MSVAEILDRGVPVNADLRVGSLVANSLNTFAGTERIYSTVSGSNTILDTAITTIYTYQLPTVPQNGSFLFIWTTTCKSAGVLGNVQSSNTLVLQHNGVTTANVNFSSISNSIGYTPPSSVGQNITATGGQVQFRFQNSNAGQTTQLTWVLEIYSNFTTL